MKIQIYSGPVHPTGESEPILHDVEGITLRDLFAMAALAGTGNARMMMESSYEKDAEHYYRMADAMLAARGAKE